MNGSRKPTDRKPTRVGKTEFAQPVTVEAPLGHRNYLHNFIDWGMGQSYQGDRIVMSLDRNQYSFPRDQKEELIQQLGSSLRTWKDKGRVFTMYRFRDRNTILHFHPKNPWGFVVDFHDLPPMEEVSLVNMFKANQIKNTRRDVEISYDIYPNNPDDLLELYQLFMAHAYLPYGRSGHFKHSGPGITPTLYFRNGKKRSRNRHFNRVYIKSDAEGNLFLRVEPQVNKNHEKYGVFLPVEFDKIQIEKLIRFRWFDYHRALHLAGVRCDRRFKETHRFNPKTPFTKTRDGRAVKARFTESQIMLAHMRPIMNSVERPVTSLLVASIDDQMKEYRETPFYHPNDMATVFPKVP